MSDELEKARSEFRRAQTRVAACLVHSQGAQGAEAAYSQAYQALVRLGDAPQIRKKYR